MAAAKALKFGSHLKELRIHLCQKSPESKGVREFLEKYYVSLKRSNPKFPILVRECSGVEAKIYARYEKGVEESASLAGLQSDQVLGIIETMEARQ